MQKLQFVEIPFVKTSNRKNKRAIKCRGKNKFEAPKFIKNRQEKII